MIFKEKKSKPALEAVILIGLTVKISLAVFFLSSMSSVAPPSAPSPFKPAVAFAQTATPPSSSAPLDQAPIGDRERALAIREQLVKEREAALGALEKQINKRLADIEATRQKLTELVQAQRDLVKEQKGIKDKRIEHLVAAYKGMRPEAAGRLMDNLDDIVAVAILATMAPRPAGMILANVNPVKAARLTKAISLKRDDDPLPVKQ